MIYFLSNTTMTSAARTVKVAFWITFSFLINLPKSKYKKISFDFLENSEYVVKYLQSVKNKVFKDVNRKLIFDLIQFYSDLQYSDLFRFMRNPPRPLASGRVDRTADLQSLLVSKH